MSNPLRVLNSLTNPVVKELVRLRESRRFRKVARSTLLTSAKVASEIVAAHRGGNAASEPPLRRLLVTDAAHAPQSLISHTREAYLVSKEIMRKVSNQPHTPDVLVECAWPSLYVDTQASASSGDESVPAAAATSSTAEHDARVLQSLSKHRFILALSSINDPGNLGTLLRTAAALNWDCVCLIRQPTATVVGDADDTGADNDADAAATSAGSDSSAPSDARLFQAHCADAMSPKAVAAARGAHWHIPVYANVTWQQLRSLPHAPLVLADAHGGAAPADVGAQLRKRFAAQGALSPNTGASTSTAASPSANGCVLVLGSEAHGLPPAELTAAVSGARDADLRVSIPVRHAAVDSLNVAAAGALLMCAMREAVLGPTQAAVGLTMMAGAHFRGPVRVSATTASATPPASDTMTTTSTPSVASSGKLKRSVQRSASRAAEAAGVGAPRVDVERDHDIVDEDDDADELDAHRMPGDEVEIVTFHLGDDAPSARTAAASSMPSSAAHGVGAPLNSSESRKHKNAPVKTSTPSALRSERDELDAGGIFGKQGDEDADGGAADKGATRGRGDDWKSRLVSARAPPLKRFSRNDFAASPGRAPRDNASSARTTLRVRRGGEPFREQQRESRDASADKYGARAKPPRGADGSLGDNVRVAFSPRARATDKYAIPSESRYPRQRRDDGGERQGERGGERGGERASGRGRFGAGRRERK